LERVSLEELWKDLVVVRFLYLWRTFFRVPVPMAYMFENLCTLYEHFQFVEWVGRGSIWTSRKALRPWESSLLQSSRLSMCRTHSSALEWFSLLWCSFLEILGGSLFRLGSKRGLLAQCVARCSFLVAATLHLYFLRLHHMTYIRSWAMRFWSWEVLKLNWIVEIEQRLWLLWFAIFVSEMIVICIGFWDYRVQFSPQFDVYPWR
jgi:hypothetical protein